MITCPFKHGLRAAYEKAKEDKDDVDIESLEEETFRGLKYTDLYEW